MLNLPVCSAGLPLKEAQRAIAEDWIAAYRRNVGLGEGGLIEVAVKSGIGFLQGWLGAKALKCSYVITSLGETDGGGLHVLNGSPALRRCYPGRVCDRRRLRESVRQICATVHR